jgi:hypothetical protein
MSDVIDRAMLHCMYTKREDWREVNGAAVHKDVTIGENVVIGGDAIIRRGTIEGGTIRGGTIEGGTIRGGTIEGGTIRGGTIWGGTIRGGTIWGGTIWGGTIEGGTIRGGTPFVLIGYLPWLACVSGTSQLSIGCEVHTFADWRENVETIAANHDVDSDTLAKVRQVIDMAEAAHAANPILEATTAAPAETTA